MSKVEMLIDLMLTFEPEDLVDCWNEFCYSTNKLDDLIYTTDYLNDWLEEHCDSYEDAFDIDKSDFSCSDDWFTETSDGSLQSFSGDFASYYIDTVAMARLIASDPFEDLCNSDIWALINSERYSEAA